MLRDLFRRRQCRGCRQRQHEVEVLRRLLQRLAGDHEELAREYRLLRLVAAGYALQIGEAGVVMADEYGPLRPPSEREDVA